MHNYSKQKFAAGLMAEVLMFLSAPPIHASGLSLTIGYASVHIENYLLRFFLL
jgi:hypothetical protein